MSAEDRQHAILVLRLALWFCCSADVELLVLYCIVAAVAIFLVWSLIGRQSKAYARHVGQLQPKAKRSKPAEQRVFGVFTRDEVAKHNTRHDAWIIVRNKESGIHSVYDVTEYVDEHPGGDSILAHIGGEATEGFYGPQHPSTAFVMAEEYCIGKLEQGQ